MNDALSIIVESAVLAGLRRGLAEAEAVASMMFLREEERRVRGKISGAAAGHQAGCAARRFFERELLPLVQAEWRAAVERIHAHQELNRH